MSARPHEMPPIPLLRCEAVGVRTPDGVPLLEAVSFELEAGESVVLWGRNGAGKTTLLRTIAGLQTATSGSVHWSERTPSSVAWIPQHLGLVLESTAIENVLCGALGRRAVTAAGDPDPRDEAHALLARMGLGSKAHVRAGKLSGGERQRVALARALLQRPRVVLADEPVASLDRPSAIEVLALLRSLAREHGCALVTVLHDAALARAHADRVVLLEGGRIVREGSPAQILPPAAPAVDPAVAPSPEPDGDPPLRGIATGAQTAGATTSSDDGTSRLEPPGRLGRLAFFAVTLAAMLVAVLWIGERSSTRWEHLPANVVDVVLRFLPPDFSMTGAHGMALLETLAMAFVATGLSAAAAFPLAFLASRNLAPRPTHLPARLLLDFVRTIPSLVWGLLAVAAFGLGPLAGTIGLAIYATGYLGKLLSETFESVPRATQEALSCTGASRVAILRHAVLPESGPQVTSHLLFVLEYNVRYGSILGVVGAGGIGFYLFQHLRSFDYPKAAAALLILFATVVTVDALSSRLRRRLREG